jgi:hypothetical protein
MQHDAHFAYILCHMTGKRLDSSPVLNMTIDEPQTLITTDAQTNIYTLCNDRSYTHLQCTAMKFGGVFATYALITAQSACVIHLILRGNFVLLAEICMHTVKKSELDSEGIHPKVIQSIPTIINSYPMSHDQ